MATCGFLAGLPALLLTWNFLFYATLGFLGFVGVILAIVFLRVTLFKDPTFSYQTALINYLITKCLSLMGWIFWWRECRNTFDIKEVQEEVLMSILKLNGKTEYGKRYHLADVKTREDFVRAHPVTKYEHYRKFVERMTNGEKNVLTKENVLYFGATSGTTGQPSIIPITGKQMMNLGPYLSMTTQIIAGLLPIRARYQRVMRLFYNPRKLLRDTPSGIKMGPISAYSNSSFLYQREVYTTPLQGFEITDNTAAEYVHLLFGLRNKDLSEIDALFVSLVYFAFRAMEHEWRTLVIDIRNGTLKPGLAIPQEVKDKLEGRMRPMPERAAELEKEFAKGFDNIAARIWPKLVLINAIASGSFQQYAKILKDKYAKDVRIFTPYYGSTEGFFGFNVWPNRNMPSDDVRFLLAARSLFFEFLPLDVDASTENPKTLFAEEVEIGKEYELLLTNSGGLYRYRIGDVVRIVDFVQQCPVIEYVHRSSQQLNIRGEKVSEVTLLAAVAHLNAHFSAQHEFSRISDFTSCESVLLPAQSESMTPHYVIFLELFGLVIQPRETLESRLGEELERFLFDDQCEGYGYQYYRGKGGISPAKVILLPPGTFARLRESMMTKTTTTSPSQFKLPRVLTKPEHVKFLCDDLEKWNHR